VEVRLLSELDLSAPGRQESVDGSAPHRNSARLARVSTPGKSPILGYPPKQGLYDPREEHDSCGVGFIAHIKGKPSFDIVSNALTMLEHMDHRGACGCEANTGDGAGILTSMPHSFLKAVAQRDAGIELPENEIYGAGIVYLPSEAGQRKIAEDIFVEAIGAAGLKMLGWRNVPTDNSMIGPSAQRIEPAMRMIFVGSNGKPRREMERALYLARKRATKTIHALDSDQANYFYVCSLSTRVLIYKGQLTSYQVRQYFTDLQQPDYQAHLALVHSRFSTNTFPNWQRAQPMRFMAHNGEINTQRGNCNWMAAREGMFASPLFGEAINDLKPISDPETSDSGNFDNCLELLQMTGRSLPHSMMMMIPEAWQNHDAMDPQRKDFYEYHSCLMEPWDGPASVAFTDGKYIGACLDRNGLRPSRYYVTNDDLVIMASEVGVLPVPPETVVKKGRLQPGRMFLVDFEEARIVDDIELKKKLSSEQPYGEWLAAQRITLEQLPAPTDVPGFDEKTLLTRQQCLGYTSEDLQKLIAPMGTRGEEALGSMGNDAALACLSDQPRLLYDYFQQTFAQVTNPPLDSDKESIVMSLECYIGPERNLLLPTAENAHRLKLEHPVLSNESLAKLKQLNHKGWKTKTIDMLFDRTEEKAAAGHALVAALERICREVTQAMDEGYSLVILSDRAISVKQVAIPALLACGAVHHHLVRTNSRTRLGLIIETGEAREVHHLATLVGYGADAVNPYLTFETLIDLRNRGVVDAKADDAKLIKNYIKAADKGLLKVMSKMGISTLQSYKGAQIFEAIGLNLNVIDRCFAGTASKIDGVDFDVLAAEAVRRHEIGYPVRPESRQLPVLPNGGQYQWRKDGETHLFSPEVISKLQEAARTPEGSRKAFADYTKLIDDQSKALCTLRGLFQFKKSETPVPLEEVEAAKEIVKRFVTGAMSMGSISPEAHETIAIAMNKLGGKSNTGEGGEDPKRFKPDTDEKNKWADGTPYLRRSAIKQVASARFGVTINYLTNADEIQIKMAQGAKPGEGGQLPGHKVDKYIGWLRHATPGVQLISPPPHHDIYSIEDLAQLIHDLKNANRRARISVKLVAEMGVGTVAAGVAKAHADHILIAGHDGGTGASPLTSIKHAGAPWELGLAETHQTLVLNDLRSRVTVQVDGQLKTGRDIVIGALLGAEEFGFSTAPLVTLGCIMMRVCHLNTCPVGIATQDPVLRKKFAGKPEHVVNFFFMLAEQVREIMAQLGIRKFNDLVGRADLLEVGEAITHWKAQGLDLMPILEKAQGLHAGVGVIQSIAQDHGLEKALDNLIIEQAMPAIEKQQKVKIELPIKNTNRTVGTMLSNEIARKYGQEGLPADTVHLKLTGNAGQSLGAWLSHGVFIELEGDANDYVGKGLSGGVIAVYPDKKATFKAEENIIIGNVALYGATSGRAYFRGVAGERFCVRNSGGSAVVEGVGDHGCEYMTGGRAVILGSTGRNFAAGMSGGIAYVFDPDETFITRCNLAMVELEKITDAADEAELKELIEQHARYTDSPVAKTILANWSTTKAQFHKVMPIEYRRALKQLAEEARQGALAGSHG
jgi:glutamate synthase (NADPH/NADH) large chain